MHFRTKFSKEYLGNKTCIYLLSLSIHTSIYPSIHHQFFNSSIYSTICAFIHHQSINPFILLHIQSFTNHPHSSIYLLSQCERPTECKLGQSLTSSSQWNKWTYSGSIISSQFFRYTKSSTLQVCWYSLYLHMTVLYVWNVIVIVNQYYNKWRYFVRLSQLWIMF